MSCIEQAHIPAQDQGVAKAVRRVVRALAAALSVAALGGCASLPSSGPTTGTILKAEKSKANLIGYRLLDVAPGLSGPDDGRWNDQFVSLAALTALGGEQPADMIRPGDVLSIAIYEVGISLFGGVANIGSAPSQSDTPTATAQRLGLQVDEAGDIRLPYVGKVHVAGRVPAAVQEEIRRRLRPFSQSPEVVVQIGESVANSVYLSGAVQKSGRYRLSAAREHLLDLVALGGGTTAEPYDILIRLERDHRAASVYLSDLRPEDIANVQLAPGDRVQLIKMRRTFTVFGATQKVAEVPFEARQVSLAEAIARAGGPSDDRANPRGVFLFRFEQTEGTERPVIYRLNLMDPQAYFTAQRFYLHNKDLVYFSNAAINPPSKLLNLINQLFGPIVTAKVVTQ